MQNTLKELCIEPMSGVLSVSRQEHLADAEGWLDEDLFLPREEEDSLSEIKRNEEE